MSVTKEQLAGGGVYRLSAVSGLIAGVSAAGVSFAFRNPSTEKACRLLYLAAKVRTVAGFTAAQELALAAHIVTSFDTGNYTSGVDLSNPASAPAYVNTALMLDSGYSYTTPRTKSVLTTGCARISDTGALSHSGSPVIQASPFAWDASSELAAAATVQKGLANLVYAPDRDGEAHLDFGSNAGFILRWPIALGAGGTARLAVDMVWAER